MQDSLVFGGNFLCGLNISMQLRVLEGEKRIQIAKRFRVPAFSALMWYVAAMMLLVSAMYHTLSHSAGLPVMLVMVSCACTLSARPHR